MNRKVLTVICGLLLLINTTGCIFLAAGAAGVGTAKWLSDKVSAEVERPMAKTVQATKDTFKELKMNLDKESSTKHVVQLLGKYSDGRQVWVDVRPINSNRSKVEVRVGWVSGEADASAILKRIVEKAESWI